MRRSSYSWLSSASSPRWRARSGAVSGRNPWRAGEAPGVQEGIGHLARARLKVPVVPVLMYGLGKALPKGSALLVPFNVRINVGEALYGKESNDDLEKAMTALAAEDKVPAWE